MDADAQEYLGVAARAREHDRAFVKRDDGLGRDEREWRDAHVQRDVRERACDEEVLRLGSRPEVRPV